MNQKYEPFVIGTAHHAMFAQKALKHLLGLKVKSAGVEISREHLTEHYHSNDPVISFWREVISGLEANGIRVVFLTPGRFQEKIHQESYKLAKSTIDLKKLEESLPDMYKGTEFGRQWIEDTIKIKQFLLEESIINDPKIDTLFGAMLKDSWTRIMEKNALKQKPEAIIAGTFHAMLMRKDLRIPKSKFSLLTPLERPIGLPQIKGIRRFQTARRKARKQRIKEITKRKNPK